MREEDLDWLLYHRIAGQDGITVDDLAAGTGHDPSIVSSSVERLRRYHLIGKSGELLRALSIQDSLMSCKLKHAMDDLPFVIENGVIKARNDR